MRAKTPVFQWFTAVVLMCLAQSSRAEQLWQDPPPNQSKPELAKGGSFPDFTRIARRSMNAVVAISTIEQRDSAEDPFREILDPNRKSNSQKGLGSGFFVNSDGYLLTNAHVVEGATKITITAWIGNRNREYSVRIIGYDIATDVALLKVDSDGEKFSSLPLGDSDELQMAEWVAAVGSPYGLAHSITVGVVSYKGTTDVAPAGRDGYYDYIQTDAPINPGNSGGPIINTRGEVVGIANAINAVGQGIGFAVPINMAKKIIPALLSEGRVRRSWLGLTVEDLSPSIARQYDLPNSVVGVRVSEVVAGSPGDAAGIKPGDIVTEFDGIRINDAQKLRWLAAMGGAGKRVMVVVERGGDSSRTSATLAPMPEADEPSFPIQQPASIGLFVRDVNVPVARLEGLALPTGALVREVKPGSAAQQAGIQKGDVILKIDDFNVYSPKVISRAVARLGSGSVVRVVVRRNGETQFLALRKP